MSEHASRNLAGKLLEALQQYGANNPQVRDAAVFLHFDNLNSDLQSNSNFDYLFSRLLTSTQSLLAEFSKLKVDDRTRKVLTLITLGASLHAVQDFYSHSDWIHNDLKHLQDENGRLKKLVAELTLDRAMLQDVLRRNW